MPIWPCAALTWGSKIPTLSGDQHVYTYTGTPSLCDLCMYLGHKLFCLPFDIGWINSNFQGYTSKFVQELLELIWLGLRKTISFCQTIHFWIRYCSGGTINWISKSKYSAGGGVVYHCHCIVVILVFPKLKCRKCVVHWCGGSVV